MTSKTEFIKVELEMEIKTELPEENLIDVKEEIYSESATTHFETDIQGKPK